MPRISKKFALLLVLTMLATMFMGMGTVSASGTIKALSTPTVAEDDAQSLGTIKVVIDADSLDVGDTVLISLSGDYEFGAAFDAIDNTHSGANQIVIPDDFGGNPGDANGATIGAGELSFTGGAVDGDSLQITCDIAPTPACDILFYIYLSDIDVSGTSDCVVSFDAPGGSGFPTGDVMVGTSSSDKQVSISVTDTDTSDEEFDVTLRLKENLAGALAVSDESIKLTLPDAYVWDTDENELLLEALWGNDIFVNITSDDEDLYIEFLGWDEDGGGAGDWDAAEVNETDEASAWDIDLEFKVSDDDEAKLGDITAKIKGDTDTNISSAVVGTYGQIGATILADDPTEVIAGRDEQEIGDIVITETLKESLVEGRTVTLTLPDGCAWQEAILDDFDDDEGLELEFVSLGGTDDRTAKFKVPVGGESTSSGAEIRLEDQEIMVRAGFTGDVTLEVGGSQGLTGSIVVAKAIAPVTMAAASTALPECIIGKAGQTIADFTLKENVAGGMEDDKKVKITVPPGTLFTALGTATVTEGDLVISDFVKDTAGGYIQFTVKTESTVPSTVSFSGQLVRVDRTVAEGAQTYKCKGEAVVETAAGDWANFDVAAQAALATVVTPAPTEELNGGVFVIGSTSYTIGGATLTADVAPYIKDSRTYLPVRYVAQALGIIDSNIMWDAAMQTVTLMKGDKVVQMKIGSNVLMVNGAAITLDVAPEISNGRTCLPIALVANAFGATASWDAATQTVTIK